MTTFASLPTKTSSTSRATVQTVSFSTTEFLNNYKELLCRNIVPCDELYSKLTEDNFLLPDVVAEIKALSTVEEKNKKLLDHLSLRGGNWITRFSDILQLSGHTLLADTIRDEISGASVIILDGREIFRRFPKLQKFLRDTEKQELTEYLINKVREEALRQSWKRDAKGLDKQKALVAKQMQLEEAIRHSEVLKDKDDTIKRLNEEILKLEGEVDAKAKEFKGFTKSIEQEHDQHAKKYDTQMQYNLANDKTLRRLTERESESNKTLTQMTSVMEEALEKYQVKRGTSSLSRKMTGKSRSSAADSDWNISPLDTAKWTLDKVIKLVGILAAYKVKYNYLYQERIEVMEALGVTPDYNLQSSVLDIVMTQMRTNRDQIDKLQNELDAFVLKEVEKENQPPPTEETVNLSDSIETLQIDLKLKESLIKQLKDQNVKLRTQLGALRVRISEESLLRRELKITRAATPFHINAPPIESESNVINNDAGSDTSSEAHAVHIRVSGPGSKPQPQANTADQQSLHLPPLNKNADFKLGQGRINGLNYGNYRQNGAAKTTHSMTTGATQISRNTGLSQSVPNNLMYKTTPKTKPQILQISSFAASKPVPPNQFGMQKNYGKQQNVEFRRNASFFR